MGCDYRADYGVVGVMRAGHRMAGHVHSCRAYTEGGTLCLAEAKHICKERGIYVCDAHIMKKWHWTKSAPQKTGWYWYRPDESRPHLDKGIKCLRIEMHPTLGPLMRDGRLPQSPEAWPGGMVRSNT